MSIFIILLAIVLILLVYTATDFENAVREWGLKLNPLVLVGFLTSFSFFLFVLYLGSMEYCRPDDPSRCSTKMEAFVNGSPNEIGDTLAGLASALAFLWIIITVMLQGRELAAQREELELTRGEYEKNRIATQEMAETASRQFDVMRKSQEEEHSERRNEENRKALGEIFMGLMIYIKSLSQNIESSAVDEGDDGFLDTSWYYDLESDILFFHYADDYLYSLLDRLGKCTKSRLEPHYQSLVLAKERCVQSKQLLNRIDGMKSEFSQSSLTMVEVRELPKLRAAVERLEAEILRKLSWT